MKKHAMPRWPHLSLAILAIPIVVSCATHELELKTTRLLPDDIRFVEASSLIEVAPHHNSESLLAKLPGQEELRESVFEEGGAMEYRGRLLLLLLPLSYNPPGKYPDLAGPFRQWANYYQYKNVRVWIGGGEMIFEDPTIDPLGIIETDKIEIALRRFSVRN